MHGEWSAKDVVATSSWNGGPGPAAHEPPSRPSAAFREADMDSERLPHARAQTVPPRGCTTSWRSADSRWALRPFPGYVQPGSMVTNFLAIAIHHYGDHAGHIREWKGGRYDREIHPSPSLSIVWTRRWFYRDTLGLPVRLGDGGPGGGRPSSPSGGRSAPEPYR
jgi:hypothetical protein